MNVMYNLLTKKLLESMPTILVTEGKWQENPPHQVLTLRLLIDLLSAEKVI